MAEQWTTALREEFPVTKRGAFFDIAYENCGSDFARGMMETYFEHKAEVYPGLVKAGGAGKGQTIGVISGARQQLAEFLNAPDIKNLAFTENTTQGLNLILRGFPFEKGDNIVVGSIEHVSVLMPCLYQTEFGVTCKIAHSKDGNSITVEDILAQVDEHTRLVAVSYVQSCSGYKIDLKKLAQECHERGVFLVTDAIQALGFEKVDVQDLGVDGLTASCYKGLLATEGVGFLYCSNALLEKVRPVFAGDSPGLKVDRENFRVLCPDPLDARKLETGTIPFQSIYGLSAGLRRISEIGIDRIERHISLCYEKIYKGLTELGYQIATPFEKAHRCHSMLICESNNEEMMNFFSENGVFFSKGRDGYVRISIAPFTSEEDIAVLLDVARLWISKR